MLIVAVVWKNSARGMSGKIVLGGQRALIQPTLIEYAEPVGGADDHDLLADPHRVGVTHPRHPHGLGHALELQERDIGGRIGRDECRAHDLTADALDGDLVHAVDDVGGRHHPAVAGDQDAGARLVEAGDPRGADVAPLGSARRRRPG